MIGRIWTRFLVFIASATLVGCPGSFREGTARVDRNAERGLAALHIKWLDAGLPRLAADCRILSAREYVVDDAGLANMCWNMCPPGACGDSPPPECARGCAAGCFYQDKDATPTAVIHESQDKWPLIRHEMLHYFAHCAGLGWDRGHKDARIWRLE